MEAATVESPDIDAKTCVFHVKRKPHLNWQPKRLVERDIVLPAEFAKCLPARRDTKYSLGLLYPSTAGKIDCNLIGFLKSAAKRARIEEHVTLHKIRRTTAGDDAARFGIDNCLKLTGCSSIAMTPRDVSAEYLTFSDKRKDMEEFFSGLVTRQLRSLVARVWNLLLRWNVRARIRRKCLRAKQHPAITPFFASPQTVIRSVRPSYA
jgi:hypothetical protein